MDVKSDKFSVKFKAFIKSAFKYKLILLYSFFVTFFFISISLVVLYQTHQAAIRQARVESKNISLSLNQNIQNTFSKVDLSLISITKLINFKSWENKKSLLGTYKLLNFYQDKLPEVFAFRIADNKGQVVLNTDKNAPTNISIFDREYFQFHKQGKSSNLFISSPMISKFNGKQIITLSRKIENKDSSFVGILYAVIELDHFHQLISSIDVGRDGNVSLISIAQSSILYRYPFDAERIGEKIDLHPEAKDLIRLKEVSGEWEQMSKIDGIKKTFGIRVNYEYGFLVSAGLAEKDYLAQWRSNCFSALVVFVVFIFAMLFGLINYILSREQIETQKSQMYVNDRNLAVGRIASGVAHEINNPLAIIQGKSELARMLLLEKKEINIEVVNKLLDIEKMVLRAARIVKGMQILGQERDEEFSITTLDDIVMATLDLLSQKMNNLKIDLKIGQSAGLSTQCNRSGMIEVFIHLISNSIDAVQNVDDKWITVNFESKDGITLIKITDSGNGIAKKELGSIMDPFFTTKPPGSGTGLGLSVARAILKNHGGSLWHNEKSIHTQFVIKIKAFEQSLQLKA